MAADMGKMIMTLGVVGAGGYVIYEYSRYNGAINTITTVQGTAAGSAVSAAMGFMSYLMAGFSAPAAGSPAAGALTLIQEAIAGTGPYAPTSSSQPPGSGSGSGQPSNTSVNQNTNSTTASQSTLPQPTSADLQKAAGGMSTGTADQWNYFYHQLTGYGIEQLYNASFDSIYGPVDSNGNRAAGIITADAFLNMPTNKGMKRVSSLSGLGAIARFYTPVVNTMASMVYRANHPSPYRFPVGMSGLGAFTQATGFEKALWAGRTLRGNKIL